MRRKIGVNFYQQVAIFFALLIFFPFLAVQAEETYFEIPSVTEEPLPDVKLSNGAATYRVPVQVPPGRNGMTPELAFNYSSFGRNSWVGVGWDLSVGSIARTEDPTVSYDTDQFELHSFAKKLDIVPHSDLGSGNYREKIETRFSRYYNPDPNSKGWIVRHRDGTVGYYGTEDENGSNDASRQYNGYGISRWHLNKLVDPNGNAIVYSYKRIDGCSYLAGIKYVEIPGGYLNRIEFQLEDNDRPDTTTNYATGSLIRSSRRLSKIKIYQAETLIRQYTCTYEIGPRSNRSRLKQILVSAWADAGAPEETLPPVVFTYSKGGANAYEAGPQTQVVSGTRHFIDLNGNGRKDLLVIKDDDFHVYTARGDGGFDDRGDFRPSITGSYHISDYDNDGRTDLTVKEIDEDEEHDAPQEEAVHIFSLQFDGTTLVFHPQPAVPSNAEAFYQRLDYDGDGHRDLIGISHSTGSSGGDSDQTTLITKATLYHYDPQSGAYSDQYFLRYEFQPRNSSDNVSPKVLFTDLNSDRRLDAIFYGYAFPAGDPYPIFLSNPNGTYSRVDDYRFGAFMHLGDINGDGLVDIITDNHFDAWVYLADGNGGFVDQLPEVNIDNIYYGIGIFDFNGDEIVDIVQSTPEADRIQAHTANGDGTFTERVLGSGGLETGIPTPSVDIGENQRGSSSFVDIDGDGLLDIVNFKHDDAYPDSATVTAYLAEGDGKPDLLIGVDNGRGATVELGYAGCCKSDTFVPFNLSPVTSRIVTDAFSAASGLRTSYAYEGGAYDPEEKDFLGFAKMTSVRPDHNKVIQNYHQDYYRKGRMWRSELRDGNDNLISLSTFTWWNPSATLPWGEVHLKASFTARYDEAGKAETFKNYTYHDECGLPLTETVTDNSGHMNGVGTVSTYINKGDWLWRLESETISEINGALDRKRHLLYDTLGNLEDDLALCRGDGCSDPDLYDYLEDKWARTHYDYDTHGNITSKTDPEGRVTSYPAYDAHNLYPAQIDYPDSEDPVTHEVTAHSEQIPEYDYRYGLPSKTIDRNGTNTMTTYDGFGRTLSVVTKDSASLLLSTDTYYYQDSPDFAAQRPAYTEHTISEVQDGDIVQRSYMDGLGRSLQTSGQWEGGTYRTTRQFFDVMGRVERTEGPYLLGAIDYDGSTPSDSHPYTVSHYDILGRAIDVTTLVGDTQTAVTGYEYEGFATETTDPDGNKRRVEKDGLGRTAIVVEYLEGEQVTTRYTYTATGDLTSVLKATDAAGFSENEAPTVSWTMTYNTLGWKLGMDDPDMGVWEYTYAADGQLASQTDEGGQKVNFAYDELGRLSEKTYDSGAPAIQYRYDKAVKGIGLLYSVTDANGSVYRGVEAYDGLGREKTTKTQISGDSERLTTYNYDLAGQLRTIAYPATGGYSVSYEYHPGSGLLARVKDDNGQLAAFDDYTAHGRLGGIDFANGVDTRYTYHPGAGRLDTLRTTAASDLIVDKTYTYTPGGDIHSITDNGTTYTYTYDSLHRLTGETDNAGSPGVIPMVIDFFYDDAGPLHAPSEITLNGQPRMVGYDENGNTTSLADMTDPTAVAERTITWTDDNLPASVTHSTHGTTSFLYDGNGKRAQKSWSGGATYYISDLFEVSDGVETCYVKANNLRIAKVTAAGKKFLHKDHLGSTVAVTNQAGARLEGKTYVPYGLTRGTEDISSTGYQFTDQERDGSTGLYNYDARLYDPVIGRFLSADTLIPDLYNPQSFNAYSYCLNNPLKYVDPSGHLVVSGSIAIGYGSYALGTALAVGVAHYAAPIAADIGKWLGEKLAEESNEVLDGKSYKGGRHKETKKPVNDGLDSHHIPSKDSYKDKDIKPDDGSAIQVEPADHRKTGSYGSSQDAIDFRRKEKELIDQGFWDDAIELGIDDMQDKFEDKYDDAIGEMIDDLPDDWGDWSGENND